MARVWISISIAIVVIAALATFIFPRQTSAEDNADLTDIFGSDWGLALLVGSQKACSHIDENKKTADKNVRRLLITNENVSAFEAKDCDGICDFAQINKILGACNAAGKVGGCMIYGALYQDKFYTTSVDASGQKLSEMCSQ